MNDRDNPESELMQMIREVNSGAKGSPSILSVSSKPCITHSSQTTSNQPKTLKKRRPTRRY
jgi:hypothetical protein